MAKVKVLKNFIGRPEEVAQNKGEIPADIAADMKARKKEMSDAEKASFDHIIVRGSTIEVTDKRAKELAALDLVEYQGISSKTVKEEEEADKAEQEKLRVAEEKENEKIQTSIADEKNKNAGPKAPAKK